MKKADEGIFHLIHSLDKSEKRYFKVFVKNLGAKSKNYLRLFDAIDKQEHYDEQELKRIFRRDKFVHHFSATKKYLFELILKSMRNYRTSYDSEVTILEKLIDFKFLLEKGLFYELLKKSQETEQLAEKYDNIYLRPIVIKWHQLAKRLYPKESYAPEVIQGDINTWRKSVKAVESAVVFEAYVIEQFAKWKFGISPLEPQPSYPTLDNLTLKVLYYQMLMHYPEEAEGMEMGLIHRKKIHDLLEEFSFVLDDKRWLSAYLTNLGTLLNLCSYPPNLHDFETYNNLLKNFKQTLIPLKSQFYIIITRLRYYKQVGDCVLGKQECQQFEELLKRNSKVSHFKHAFIIYFEMACLYFINAEFELALSAFEKSLTLIKSLKAHHFLAFNIQLLKILVFLEKEEWILIESLSLSLRRKIDKEAPFKTFGTKMLSFINKLIDNNGNVDTSLQQLKMDIESTFIDLPELLYFFPYDSWLESKIKSQNLKQLLEKKYLELYNK